ncbi:hypothetical protein [Methylobacterium tarhaniae]|nr:hypothetical protein [Methylobacterium tarhaniae]
MDAVIDQDPAGDRPEARRKAGSRLCRPSGRVIDAPGRRVATAR